MDCPVCKMSQVDYHALEESMRSVVGWPVVFSWNKDGQIWLGSAVLGKPDATILTEAPSTIRPAALALSSFLMGERRAGHIARGELFYISDKRIYRKSDRKLWGCIEFQ